MNKILFFWIALMGVNAYALPIPEFTSAVFGLGEVFLLVAGILGIYFPFLKKGNKWLYLVLVLSLGLNGYYLMSDYGSTRGTDTTEVRPGMLMTQEERNNDPRAIDEDKAYALMQQQRASGNNKYVFVDARSQSETELGTAEGFIKVRWPDLVENYKDELKGRTVIATCWTGMRGSEVCDKLRAHGIDCMYLKEGLKGWVARNLPIVLAAGVALETLGTAETYENSEKLLTAREVVNAKNTTIIDPRTPDLFNKSSIPGSVNIPFGELPTNEMEYRVKTLSTQNVIVACYSILSCSEASGWGWEMRRLGHTYLGTYSGGVDAYNKMKAPKEANMWELLPKHFNIYYLIGFSSFVLGLLLWITKAMSVNYFREFNERKKSREKLIREYDEVVAQRETNVKSDLISIGKSFVILGLALVYSYAIGEIINWGKYLSLPNWLVYVGSLLVGVGLTKLVFKKIDKIFLITATAITLGSFIILKQFSLMGILMLVLTCLVMYFVDLIGYLVSYKNVKFKQGYVDLFDAHYVIPAGTKAYRLSELKHLNVPEGIVVNKDFKGSNFALKRLGEIFTVRSSALNEDNADSSHAGLNLSIVPSSEKTWLNDIQKVFESYGQISDKEVVLLQRYIDPVFAGVVFSRHPTWGGTILIEYGSGLAAKRMDGSENVRQVVLERATGCVVFASDDALLKYVPQIYQLLMSIENIYKADQDVEWAIDKEANKSKLWLLQARPQTALSYDKLNQDKHSLLKPGFKTLKTCELSFVMENATPLSASLICSLWDSGSSADIASRKAMWSYKKKLNMQAAYVYKFGRIWNSDYPVLVRPNKFNTMIAKKMYKPDAIRLECNQLLKQNQIHLAVDWNILNDDDWIALWNVCLKNWKQMQALAFYFEYMASIMDEDVSHFTADTSYRALNDYEISEPRAIETGQDLRNLLFGDNSANPNKAAIYLREEYKHHCLTLYYSLRRAILNLQKQFDMGHEIFNMEYHEIEHIFEVDFRNSLKNRMSHVYQLPEIMDAKTVALLGLEDKSEHSKQLKGVFVSHPQDLKGHLLRIASDLSIEEIKKLLSEKGNGAIVYSSFISPALVNIAKDYGIAGLCSLYGSTLSHPSILAREAKIPFVVGINIADFEGSIKINKEGHVEM
jgi:rhodanese-related sulfurtransferase